MRYRHSLTTLMSLSLLRQTLHHEAWPLNDLGMILTFMSGPRPNPKFPSFHFSIKKTKPQRFKLQRGVALMKERWGMLQLNPHLLVWNTYFTDLIRILRTAKGRVENESKEGGGGGEKAEDTEMCGSVVTNWLAVLLRASRRRARTHLFAQTWRVGQGICAGDLCESGRQADRQRGRQRGRQKESGLI